MADGGETGSFSADGNLGLGQGLFPRREEDTAPPGGRNHSGYLATFIDTYL